ncbi:MAG TPA: class I SAM-dependent methyltransferase [Candidatus Nanoarchaeia archaeon]|nr:class I SAM-dependent methyltransferase [Candidatus Nanoarchaeia archaeon]
MKSSAYVKGYFRRNGTVVNWWNPTQDDYVHIYLKQQNIIKEWIKKIKPLNTLEVSCGKGRITKVIAKYSAHYSATDISSEMINIAKKNCSSAKFKVEDAEKLSLKSNSQNVVICLESLVHYPNPEKAIKEFYRVLQKEGVLIIDVDNKYSLRRIIKCIYNKFFNIQEIGQDIFRSYSKKEFIRMFANAGFMIEKFKYLGTFGPIRVRTKSGKQRHLVSVGLSKYLSMLPLDSIPGLNELATYYLVEARK